MSVIEETLQRNISSTTDKTSQGLPYMNKKVRLML